MKFFLNKYFANFTNALLDLDLTNIERAVEVIDSTRKKKGRMFILAVISETLSVGLYASTLHNFLKSFTA